MCYGLSVMLRAAPDAALMFMFLTLEVGQQPNPLRARSSL